jgi:aryl-phospho-beta-D-glucosidase BglC (GH1 family)
VSVTGGNLLPTGYLSTQGNQIVDASGNPVRIASVGWNEIGASPLGGIQADVDAMKAVGFNTIRIPWYDATMSSDLAQIDQVVAAASNAGIKVILDHHGNEAPSASNGYGSQQANGLPFDLGPGTDGTDGMGDAGTVTEAQFVQNWQTVAQHYAGNSTVIGFDLDNEPLAYAGQSTWGDGGVTDLRSIYEQAGNAIQSVDPGALIIAEGPQNYNQNFAGTAPAPYGDLSLAGKDPVTLGISNKVVYSVHAYPGTEAGYGPDSGAAAVANMNADFGYLETQNIAPVWIGEMGSSMISADSQAWASTIVSYVNGHEGASGGPTFSGNQLGMGTDWWAWGNLAGQFPNGTLNADGSLNAAQQAVYSQLQTSGSTTTSTPTLASTSTSATNAVVTTSTDDTITVADTTASITLSQSNMRLAATSGDHMVFVQGSGNTVALTGGHETITDTGSNNSYIIPAAGNGYETFTSDILQTSNTLDLRSMLAATEWAGDTASIGDFVHVASDGQGAIVSVSSSAGGAATAVATIDSATTATLSTLLAHAIT